MAEFYRKEIKIVIQFLSSDSNQTKIDDRIWTAENPYCRRFDL